MDLNIDCDILSWLEKHTYIVKSLFPDFSSCWRVVLLLKRNETLVLDFDRSQRSCWRFIGMFLVVKVGAQPYPWSAGMGAL